jgi:serine/threonine protein kinase
VHRDVKPSNLLLQSQRGRLRVADLGIARALDGSALLTTTGAVAGTFHYIAPEVWQAADTVDHRADQYSLGVVFYELLTGQLPVPHSKPASQLNRTVPAAFDQVL